MQMPSLFKYFTVVGSVLLGLLLGINYVLDPGGPAKREVAAPKIVVQHDPRASLMERWRNEQAALKAAEQARAEPAAPAEPVTVAAKGTQEPARLVPAVATSAPAAEPQAQVVQAVAVDVAPTQSRTAALSAQPETQAQADTQADEAARAAEAKKKAAKIARKARRDRERALAARGEFDPFYAAARQRSAANQQDQYYYGQRSAWAQPQAPFGYAPRPSFGPFGGFGRGW